MPNYSSKSRHRLDTASYNLQRLFTIVIAFYDNVILEGWRSLSEQKRLYRAGLTKVEHSKHNESPAQAIDSAPWLPHRGIPWPQIPSDWRNKQQRDAYIKDLNQFYHYAGFVQGVAANEGIDLRWGGDWDRDNDISDQSFNDLIHFETTHTQTTEV